MFNVLLVIMFLELWDPYSFPDGDEGEGELKSIKISSNIIGHL